MGNPTTGLSFRASNIVAISMQKRLLCGLVAIILVIGFSEVQSQPFLDEPIELSVDTEISEHYNRQRIQSWSNSDTSRIIVATEFEREGDSVRALLKAWIGGKVQSLDDGRAIPMDWVATVPVAGGFLVAWNDHRPDAPGIWTARISKTGDMVVPPALYLEGAYGTAIAYINLPGQTLLLLGYRPPEGESDVTGLISAFDNTTVLSEIRPLAGGLPSSRWSWTLNDGRILQGVGADSVFIIERDGAARYLPLPPELFTSRRYFIGDSMVIYYSDNSLIALELTEDGRELWRLLLPESMRVEHVLLSFDSVGFFVQSAEAAATSGTLVGCYKMRRLHVDLEGMPIDSVHLVREGCTTYGGGVFSTDVATYMTPGVGSRRNDMSLLVTINVTLYYLGHFDDPRHHSSEYLVQAFGRAEDERTDGYIGVGEPRRETIRGRCQLSDPGNRLDVLLSLDAPPRLTNLSKTWPMLGHSGPVTIGWFVPERRDIYLRDGKIPRQELKNDSNAVRVRLKNPVGRRFRTEHGWIGFSTYREEGEWLTDMVGLYGGKMILSRLTRDDDILSIEPLAYSGMPSGEVSKLVLRYITYEDQRSRTELIRMDASGEIRGRQVVNVVDEHDQLELLCLGENYTGFVVADSVVHYVGPFIEGIKTDTLRRYPGFKQIATAVLADSSWIRLLTNRVYRETIIEHHSQSGELIRTRGLDLLIEDDDILLPHADGRALAIIEYGSEGIHAFMLGPALETITADAYRSPDFLRVADVYPLGGEIVGRWSNDTLVVAWQGVNNDSIPVVQGNVMTLASEVAIVDRGPDLPADYIRRRQRDSILREEERIRNYDYWEQYRTGDSEVIGQLTPEQRQDIFGFAIQGVTPNPTYGEVTLRIGAAYSLGAYLEIFDAAGKRLYYGLLDLHPDLHDYRVPDEFGETGVYTVRVSSPEYADEVRVLYIGR